MNELKLTRSHNDSNENNCPWRRKMPNDGFGVCLLCGNVVAKHVSIPNRVREITIVFSPTRMEDSFKFRLNPTGDTCNPIKISGLGSTALYHDMDMVLKRQLRNGNQYARVEYV